MYLNILLFQCGNRLHNKHETFNQCCFNVAHFLRRWPNIKTTLVKRLVFTGFSRPWYKNIGIRSKWRYQNVYYFLLAIHLRTIKWYRTRRRTNAGPMLAHRLRRWPNIKHYEALTP